VINIERAKDFFVGHLRGVSIVANYMKDSDNNVLDVLIRPTCRETYMHGLFLRAAFWMLTLEKLNTPRDVQAIQSCTRSLLEITTDMILLHNDKTKTSIRMMLYWDRSQKLHAGETMVEYYKKRNLPIPDVIEDVAEFVQNKKARIQKKRLALWNTIRHPSRWTGNRSLLADVIEADRQYGSAISADLKMTLEEYYETEYRRLNWFVHGSGLTGIMKLEPEIYYSICGVAFKWCSDMAMLCTKIIFTDYGLVDHLPGLKDKWLNLELSRGLAYMDQVKTPISQDKS
jgi:hypothetical protein